MATPPFPLEQGRTDPISLLLGGIELLRLRPAEVGAVGDWVAQCGEDVDPDSLKEPTLRFSNYLQHGSSVIALAVKEWDTIAPRARHYDRARVDDLARLLIAATLLTRFRGTTSQSETSNEEARAVAQARGWSNLEDAIAVLKDEERCLVVLGKSALIDHPAVQEEYLLDEDDGSFADAFSDVRRRLDMALKHSELFEAVGLDAARIHAVEQLLQDAIVFHRGRESAGAPARKMTLQRDMAFSLSLIELKKLQAVLEAALWDRPELQDRIGGTYWRRVDSFARSRRPRKTEEPGGETPPRSPSEADWP
ncbi:MAG: hypothetical protein ACOC1F_08200 [Myxococcota bacterium]